MAVIWNKRVKKDMARAESKALTSPCKDGHHAFADHFQFSDAGRKREMGMEMMEIKIKIMEVEIEMMEIEMMEMEMMEMEIMEMEIEIFMCKIAKNQLAVILNCLKCYLCSQSFGNYVPYVYQDPGIPLDSRELRKTYQIPFFVEPTNIRHVLQGLPGFFSFDSMTST